MSSLWCAGCNCQASLVTSPSFLCLRAMYVPQWLDFSKPSLHHITCCMCSQCTHACIALSYHQYGLNFLQEHRYWVDQPQSALTEYDASAATHWHRLGISSILGGRRQHLDYYELLEVPRDAAPEHIRRQYYKLARR